MKKNEIYLGDCLIEQSKIESGSVDLILTDLPFGNMQATGLEVTQNKKERKHDWDFAIEPQKVYEIANRILRKNGKMILFSQEPYTTKLITEAIPNIPFSYRAIWEKDNFAVSLGVNRNMVGYFEDILIFSKKDCDIKSPSKKYTNKIRAFINKKNYDIYNDFEQAGFKKYAVLDTFNSDTARRFNFPSEQTYNNLIELYGIDKMEGFRNYEDIKEEYLKDTPNSVFNLWEGNKYKSNILKYKKDYDGLHPTQKPILLLEDLIKTFSNENDLVVDLTAGSFSTAVACKRTNRNFICIEKDEKYFNIGNKRLNGTLF